ncbi:hypothetical protein QFZ24_004045 [Streptomyces phaeochromogenes]|uniref:hypothetical protein n=1 Tax=Streptomyces phaeochromogenes TaxID=1923 RepID=UPI00279105A1|nr:hypothetical protein [Streptomyces phaeochromogenes]MDQ0950122.1 hypothetical protein [Streptomyces phaeochromogenes]
MIWKEGKLSYLSELFEVDGSLRDVCVLDARVEDWDRVVRDLVESDWQVEFTTTHPRGAELLRAGAPELFAALEQSGEDSATLAVCINDIWFTSYFFESAEIEFTFDPSDVVDESGVLVVDNFMKRIGDACGKRVVMTMESTDHEGIPALLEYRPGSIVE